MGSGPLGLGENASGLYHNLGAHLAPGDLGWVSLGEDADGPLIDHQVAVADHDGAGEAAVVGVVLEQVGVRVAVRKVVHRNDFQVGRVSFQNCLEHLPTNPAKTVDPNLGRHAFPPSIFLELRSCVGLEGAHAAVTGISAQLLFYAQQAVVLGHPLRPRRGSRLDLPGVQRDGEVGDGRVLSLAGAVADDVGPSLRPPTCSPPQGSPSACRSGSA